MWPYSRREEKISRVLDRGIVVVTKHRGRGEFLALVDEAGYEVAQVFPLRNVTSQVLSEWKLNQLKERVEALGVETVIFDISLKPRQTYHIAERLQTAVKDRVEVILKIFLLHAPTQEAKLQVKLASLRYELARAKEKVRLAKIGEQPGFEGLGSYKVDVYYEEVQRRASKIDEKLRLIRSRREIHRIRRAKIGIKTLSITGYTCSGKTTLFNGLTGLLQSVGEEPFTTLSTKFSRVRMGPWRPYVIDTIGFISDLPPFMINAFYSTLEEISFSDIILLVVDVSEPLNEVFEKFRTGYNLLIDLDVIDRPIVVVANKMDLVDESISRKADRHFLRYTPHVVKISALRGENLDDLVGVVTRLMGETVKAEFFIPFSSGDQLYSLLDELESKGLVEEYSGSADGVRITTALPSHIYKRLAGEVNDLGGRIRVHSGTG
jgi:GTP-binding protein HflX